jgi:hypothetical protein
VEDAESEQIARLEKVEEMDEVGYKILIVEEGE